MKFLQNSILLLVVLFSSIAVNASHFGQNSGFTNGPSENEPIDVYPIPANTQFHIDLKNNDFSEVTYKLVNLESGLTTEIKNENVINNQVSSFDVSFVPTGTYMLVIEENGKSIFSKRLVINHFGS